MDQKTNKEEFIKDLRRKFPKYYFHYKCAGCGQELEETYRLYHQPILVHKFHGHEDGSMGVMYLTHYRRVEEDGSN